MNQINKDRKKVKLDIKLIHKEDGTKLHKIFKEEYLCYLRNVKSDRTI